MNKTICFLILVLLLPTVLAGYEIELEYNNGEISLLLVNANSLEQKQINIEGRYIAEVVSNDNKILNITFFSIPTTIISDEFNEETGEFAGGFIRELEQVETTLYLPYYPNAKEINIYDSNLSKKLTIPVSQFAKQRELFNQIQHQIGAESRSQEAQDSTTQPTQTPVVRITISVIALLLFIILIVFIIRLKKKQPDLKG